MGRWRWVGVLAALVAVLPACGDDDGGSSATTAGDDPIAASFELAGDPDFMAAGDGSLWVKAFGGTVYRIDPETNEVAAEIELTGSPCDGIGASDDIVWTCGDEGLVPIDPATEEPGEVVAVQKVADQGVIPVIDGQAWVLTGDGSAIVAVTEDGPGEEIDLGVRCTQPAVGDASTIWIACLPDDTVIEFDPASGEVLTTVDGVVGPHAAAVTGSDVWVTTEDGLVHIDGEAGEVAGTSADADVSTLGGVAADGDQVWVRSSGPLAQRIDPSDLSVAESIDAPVGPGGSVQIAFDAVWVTAFDDKVLYRIDR